MLQPSSSDSALTLQVIEACSAAIAFAVALAAPRLGFAWYSRVEHLFGKLARHRRWSVVTVGLSALLLRLALLPLFPIPQPFIQDDFSFLLAADTFAHGRLANPTPAMWSHFESIHITMKPTYMSMYFPAPGLLMAAGKLLLGSPWYGILCASALMCAAICWMLQAWLPASWALLGGMLAVLRLGLFSYWINTYTGGGVLSALGGALVLGALPRLMKTAHYRHGLLLAAGLVLMAFTRPYEGLLLSLPVAIVLGRWIFFGKNRPRTSVLLRLAAAPLLLLVAAGAWMGYYDYRAFGTPFTLPYTIDRATYAIAPYFIWQSERPAPVYRHEVLRSFYCDYEPRIVSVVQTPSGYFTRTLDKIRGTLLFFAGTALLSPLIMLRRVFLDRRTRFLLLCVFVLMAGMAIEIYLIPHYLAPFTAAFYALGLQAMRHLRVWSPEGKTVGLTLVRFLVTLCVVMAGLRVFAEPLHLVPPKWPAGGWLWTWYGPGHFGTKRARIEAQLDQMTGRQLVIVRYSPDHYPYDEWVYNAADIDGSRVIWAREMDAGSNLELIRYYKDRKIWLVQPDMPLPALAPYPIPGQAAASLP